jgi:hypothetical protein
MSGDVWRVSGAVSAAVLVADGGGGERDEADEGEVVVLPWAHRGERERGGEHGAEGVVVPASDADVASCSFAGQRDVGARGDGGEAGEDVHGEDGEEDRRGGPDLGAEDSCGVGHGGSLSTSDADA